MRLDPAIMRLRAKAMRNRSFRDAAITREMISPATVRETPAAICLPGEFERVLAVQSETTLEQQVSRLRAGPKQQVATYAYELRDVLFADGAIYYSGGYTAFRAMERPVLFGPVQEIDEAALATSFVIEKYFGHWLLDSMVTEVLARSRGLDRLQSVRKPWTHEAEYRALFGLPASPVRQGRIARLHLFDDIGLNEGMSNRLQELRSRVAEMRVDGGPTHIFIRRGQLGANRLLRNETVLETELQRRGYGVLDPERASVAEIGRVLGSARVVVAVEGSAQSHAMVAMPQGSTMITIQPPRRFNSIFKGFADALGISWAYAVADESGDGFVMPVERLLATIDLAEAAR